MQAQWRSRSQERPFGGAIMLYESTRSLLQSIVQSLETGGQTRWDDRTESGNTCLYEMHQMCRPLYKPYKPDRMNGNSALQDTIPELLNRAMPHVRTMVIAIRHKDQTRAIASGRAALAEMNCANHATVSGDSKEAGKSSAVAPRREKLTGRRGSALRRHVPVKDR